MSDAMQMEAGPPTEENADEARVRRSAVSFPYVALDDAVEAARAIYENAGRECDQAQLAAWLKSTPTSSKFRSTISAASMFGLLQRRSKMIVLTELGADTVDPTRQDAARVKAFLGVPLYRQVYETFSEKLLPPDTGLEAELRNFGVTEKSVTRARQVLRRSATYAGFFRADRDRLVKPVIAQMSTETTTSVDKPDVEASEPTQPGSAPDADWTGPTDPLLRGLWSKLPPDEPFSEAEQDQWLELARLALRLVYGGSDVPDARALPSGTQASAGVPQLGP